MSFNLIREIVKENRIVDRKNIQIIVEHDIIIPDAKHDINTVLFADSSAFILDTHISEDNVLMKGIMRYNILYIEEGSEYNIGALNTNIDFEHSMDIPGVNHNMKSRIGCDVEHVECQIINGRKVNMKVILGLKSKIREENEYYFISDIEESEDIQVLRDSVTANKFIGSVLNISCIKESLEVPSGNPPIIEILRNDLKIVNIGYTIADNKIIVKGETNIQTLYIGNERGNNIKFMEHEAIFTRAIDFPGVNEESEILIDYEIQNYSFEPSKDEDGELRIMNGEFDLAIWASGTANEEIDMITDAYGLRRNLDLEGLDIRGEELVVENRNQAIIKETLTVGEDSPEIVEILKVFSKPVLLEYEIKENLVDIEGIITNHVLCYTNSPEEPIFCWKQDIPLRQSIEVQGIKPEMICEIDLQIEHSNYSISYPKNVEVRLVAGITSKFYKETKRSVIEKIAETVIDGDRTEKAIPSITLYFVKEGESLWDISKRYRVVSNDIMKENRIEDESTISPGTQVLISRN